MSDKLTKYLTALGLRLPENEKELEIFENASEGYTYVLKEEAIDPLRILEEIKAEQQNQNNKLSKSQSFFRRLVLAAKIADECHNELRFGSVKFQKLVYLCEWVSKMEFHTNYSKQAAGPFDNRFMHTVKAGFKKQGWFEVKRVTKNGMPKTIFKPLDNLDAYKPYYFKYYGAVASEIDSLINTFRTSYTNDVELVATIFECWLEIIKSNSIYSDNLIIQKVYAWNKSKKKFSEQDIVKKIVWMREQGIYPVR